MSSTQTLHPGLCIPFESNSEASVPDVSQHATNSDASAVALLARWRVLTASALLKVKTDSLAFNISLILEYTMKGY